MAIDEEIITNFIATAGLHFTSELPNYLECAICTNVLQDPVCCESGPHTFCKKCLNGWIDRNIRPHCPIDREELTRRPEGPRRAPRALQECIDALEVLCALGCGWKGPQVKWPDHLRHDCPEVEGDESESRQRRDGSVPLAIRAARELEEAAEEEAIAEDEARVIQREVPDPNGNNDDEDAQALVLALIDKRTGAICDACQSEIFNEGYMCVACPDHDICSECWLDGARTTHDATHAFVKLRNRNDYFPGERNAARHADGQQVSAPAQAADGSNVHFGITCDGCLVENMVGIRYQCRVCDDFDLCSACVGQDMQVGTHTKDHDMLRISKPKLQIR
ncbi:hypothetical protein P389DRAFT_191183 [Cystobasidium minutum MCA 4210]|uniref:uncharacterized protein n=1 Tax=Cystobasidium minutum MCA 4210 TaxID=1397322 RepID=UPI0034CE7DCD|eukprot:jgi/Rhomi1/191183/estExt_fgenesh1_pg.C_70175